MSNVIVYKEVSRVFSGAVSCLTKNGLTNLVTDTQGLQEFAQALKGVSLFTSGESQLTKTLRKNVDGLSQKLNDPSRLKYKDVSKVFSGAVSILTQNGLKNTVADTKGLQEFAKALKGLSLVTSGEGQLTKNLNKNVDKLLSKLTSQAPPSTSEPAATPEPEPELEPAGAPSPPSTPAPASEPEPEPEPAANEIPVDPDLEKSKIQSWKEIMSPIFHQAGAEQGSQNVANSDSAKDFKQILDQAEEALGSEVVARNAVSAEDWDEQYKQLVQNLAWVQTLPEGLGSPSPLAANSFASPLAEELDSV
ncbi:MAG: hypothetical protein VW378_07955 [bacterium]